MGKSDSSVERLGEFLVRIGALTPEKVEQVLEIQKSQPDRLFGQIAIDLGYITDSHVDQFLEQKRIR